jgi:hypothetical protein
VLVGGACASLHSRGAFVSLDVDFVLVGPVTQPRLDAALASVGFVRRGDRYVHPRVRFFVEFPRGPLAIGNDVRIRPVARRGPRGRALVLSATDACRDRLAAFYHWNDRQSLAAALAIARANRLKLRAIRAWSAAQGAADRFEEFARALRRRGARPRS